MRPRLAGASVRRLVQASSRRNYATDTDVDSARRYCLAQLQHSDYDAHLIRRFVPTPVQDTYAALRALNLELVRLPELVSNPTIGALRMKFWQESIDNTFAGRPPREPICLLLDKSLKQLEERAGAGTKKSIKFWISRLIKTREKYMDNRPYSSLASLEEYGENTYSTLMYATLASMPLRSMEVDHLASHIGKACGIVAVLRGIPVLAAPSQAVKTPSGSTAPSTREPTLRLPLDVMAEEGVKEEEVFRQGPNAPGLQDAVFKVATRANDHLITAREMLKRLKAGEDAGHDFEHQGEGEHIYMEQDDPRRDIKSSFGVLLEAIPAAYYLESLEKANFDPPSSNISDRQLYVRFMRRDAMIIEEIDIGQTTYIDLPIIQTKAIMIRAHLTGSPIGAAGGSYPPTLTEPVHHGKTPGAALQSPVSPRLNFKIPKSSKLGAANSTRPLLSRPWCGCRREDAVRPGSIAEVKEFLPSRIASTVGTLVLRNGGVIRGLNNWGVFSLAKPVSVHQMRHTHGHYFVMRYDSSTKVHETLRSTLSLEPRMIRAAHVKLGDGKLETMARIGGPKWSSRMGEM
ncbi:NADH dehydrogenase-like protein [Paramyrothecium foliicola]|nr:NADH dehydrogenase-like protein [Paramyrothecium foliicola]